MNGRNKRFVGIDLGTSNSAIATYENGQVQVWKDPEQKEVTASVIYVSGRGTKSVGNRAYASAVMQSSHGARLFNRLMGSDTKVPMKGLKEEWTPEQCSAEILRTMVSYIPTELQDDIAGIVVTVPAAFDQAQKSATLQAAEDAGIGAVTLLQEPVAAVMAATQNRTKGGYLVVYDLGGGTLDVAVAEWTKRGIILHAHGGIPMCGGRDIDRAIYDEVIKPWIEDTFSMPDGWEEDTRWKANGEKGSLCCYAAELAKIRLSSQEDSKIELEEHQFNVKDTNGEDLYLDIPLSRDQLDAVMPEIEEASVEAVRKTLRDGGFEPENMDEVVFIGGPTQYERLRARVCASLGIAGQVESDPMTAEDRSGDPADDRAGGGGGVEPLRHRAKGVKERRGRPRRRAVGSTSCQAPTVSPPSTAPAPRRPRRQAPRTSPAPARRPSAPRADAAWSPSRSPAARE